MSASRSPTLAPSAARATARWALTVDFPTPPLPLAIAIVFLTPGSRPPTGAEERTFEVMRISTTSTPARPVTASRAWPSKRSRTGQAGVVSSKVKLTRPPSTFKSLIIPSDTTSRPRSGSLMVARAPITSAAEGPALLEAISPRPDRKPPRWANPPVAQLLQCPPQLVHHRHAVGAREFVIALTVETELRACLLKELAHRGAPGERELGRAGWPTDN